MPSTSFHPSWGQLYGEVVRHLLGPEVQSVGALKNASPHAGVEFGGGGIRGVGGGGIRGVGEGGVELGEVEFGGGGGGLVETLF